VTTWALVTGDYSFQPGGVGDYTRLVALGCARALFVDRKKFATNSSRCLVERSENW